MKCRKNLEGEFYVYTYVGNEKRMLKLIQVDTAESESNKTSAKETETSDSDAQSEGQKKISSEGSIVEVDTEESIQELLVVRGKPEEITINSDSDRSSSTPNTASIYADQMDINKSRLSLQTVSSMSMSLSTTDGYEMETTDTDAKQHVTDLSHVRTVKLTESTEKTTEKGKPFTETDPRNLSQWDFCSVTYTDESDEVESDPKSPVLDAKAEGGEQGDVPDPCLTDPVYESETANDNILKTVPSVPENGDKDKPEVPKVERPTDAVPESETAKDDKLKTIPSVPENGDKDKPENSDKDVPENGDKDKPEVPKVERPTDAVPESETANDDKLKTVPSVPENGDKDKPENGDKDKPENSDKDKPEVPKVQSPTDAVPESETAKDDKLKTVPSVPENGDKEKTEVPKKSEQVTSDVQKDYKDVFGPQSDSSDDKAFVFP